MNVYVLCVYVFLCITCIYVCAIVSVCKKKFFLTRKSSNAHHCKTWKKNYLIHIHR